MIVAGQSVLRVTEASANRADHRACARYRVKE
jgi:hypothetical protein